MKLFTAASANQHMSSGINAESTLSAVCPTATGTENL